MKTPPYTNRPADSSAGENHPFGCAETFSSVLSFACGDLLARKEVDINKPNVAAYASIVGANTEEMRQ
jgi:hypothetical protein